MRTLQQGFKVIAGMVALAAAAGAQPHELDGRLATPLLVRGTLAGAHSEEVLLLDEGDWAVARGAVEASGRFQLTAPGPGVYKVAIRRRQTLHVLQEVVVSSREPVLTLALSSVDAKPLLRPARQAVAAEHLVGQERLARRIPKEAQKSFDQARGLVRRGHSAEAVEKLEKAIALAPDYLEALNNLAIQYMRRGEDKRAEDLLRRSVALDATAWQPRLNLALVLMNQQAHEPARSELARALDLAPNSPLPPFHLGRLHVLLGQIEQAERWFHRALEIDPGFPMAHLYRGYARLQTGRRVEGRADLAAYLALVPKAEDAARVREQIAQIDKQREQRRGGEQ